MPGLADAARCRSESDWLIGINGTRALTKRMFGSRAGNVASVGRVQTPTLAIVYARELEIRNFKPRGYWRVTATFGVAAGRYEGVYQRPKFKKGENDEHDRVDRIWDKAAGRGRRRRLPGQTAAPVTEEKKAGTQIAPRLYDLTTLQREANNRFGFPPKPHPPDRPGPLRAPQDDHLPAHRLARAARGLHAHLPRDAANPARATSAARRQGARQGWVRPNKRIFNNAQISDHFAIIPTVDARQEPRRDGGEGLRHDRAPLRRGVLPAGEFDVTTRISTVAGHDSRPRARCSPPRLARRLRQAAVDDDAPNGQGTPCPRSRPTDNSALRKTLGHQAPRGTTKPPPRYTEATLLSAMEGAGKLVDDEDLAEAMKERARHAGHPRRHDRRLINQKYIERQQRELVPTAKAEQLLQFLAAVKADGTHQARP
jgi:DNA topoisomerase III